MPTHHMTRRNPQRGAALFVGVVLLVIISLMAIAASGTSVMQERMAGGTRNVSLAFNGGESALRGAENLVFYEARRSAGDMTSGGDTTMRVCTPQLQNAAGVPCYRFAGEDTSADLITFRTASGWVEDFGTDYTRIPYETAPYATAVLSDAPKFVIEDLGVVRLPGTDHCEGGDSGGGCTDTKGMLRNYRLTARSRGGSDSVVRAVESTYSAVPF